MEGGSDAWLGDDGTENSEQEQGYYDYASLFRAVLANDWSNAQVIFSKRSGEETAWLVAAYAIQATTPDSSFLNFVKHHLDLIQLAPLELSDMFGRTPLHFAAMAGNTEAAKILVKYDPSMVGQIDNYDELPLHIAARHAHKETLRYLLSVCPVGSISDEAGARLLELLIIADFHGIALKLLNRRLASRSYSPQEEEEPTSPRCLSQLLEVTLQALAKRPQAFARRRRHRFWLNAPHHCLRNSEHYMEKPRQFGFLQLTDRTVFVYPHAFDLLRLSIREILKRERALDTQQLGGQLCIAAKFGNYEVVVEILRANPILLWHRDENWHGFLQIAVLHGQERVFNLLHQLGSIKHDLLSTHDRKGNNILHLAAARGQPSSASSAALQVQRNLHWFKELEKHAKPALRNKINRSGLTPREVFGVEHEKLLKEGDKWMKKTAQSCTVVAALVVTVVFAAAFTVPGGNNDINGIPHYLMDASFMTFAISDTLGLVSSTTSLLMFLSILSSRFSEEDLLKSRQYIRLSIGLVALFFSIASMLVTFTASLHIVLGHRVKWIAVPLGILASVPVILFVRLQFPLLSEIVYTTFRPIFFSGGKVSSC